MCHCAVSSAEWGRDSFSGFVATDYCSLKGLPTAAVSKRSVAHGKHSYFILPCKGSIKVSLHTRQKLCDPFRVGRRRVAPSGGGASLAPVYYRAGLQPARSLLRFCHAPVRNLEVRKNTTHGAVAHQPID